MKRDSSSNGIILPEINSKIMSKLNGKRWSHELEKQRGVKSKSYGSYKCDKVIDYGLFYNFFKWLRSLKHYVIRNN